MDATAITPAAAPPVRAALNYPLATILVVAGALVALMLIDAAVAAWSPSKRGLWERVRDAISRAFAPATAAPAAAGA
jgi:hypothetical protein